jgi:hypothetical protein
MNMLGLSSSVSMRHTACYWKFFLFHYIQILCQYRLGKADHTYLTCLMLQRHLIHLNGRNPSLSLLYINCTALHCLGSSLYSLGVDPTENTDSNDSSVVVMDGCLAIEWISVPPLLRAGCLFIRLLHSNSCTRPFRGLCPTTVLYATVCTFNLSLLKSFVLICYITTVCAPRLYRADDWLVVECGAVGGIRNGRENRSTRRKPASMPRKVIKCRWWHWWNIY